MRKQLTAVAVAGVGALLFIQGASAQQTNSYSKLLSISDLKDVHVKNLQNQDIGEINQVLIDPSSGRVRFVVLDVGGFLLMGETTVAVPWDALRISQDGDHPKYVLDASKERLEKAPRVEGKRYDRLYSRQEAEPTFVYWGITWYDLGPMSSPSPSVSSKSSTLPSHSASPTSSASASPTKK